MESNERIGASVSPSVNNTGAVGATSHTNNVFTGLSVNGHTNSTVVSEPEQPRSSKSVTPAADSEPTTTTTTTATNTTATSGTTDGSQPTKKYTVKFKRSRSSRACSICHSRKVRCDAMIQIPCTNCVTFGCECKFPEQKIRKNARILKDKKIQLKPETGEALNKITDNSTNLGLDNQPTSIPTATAASTTANSNINSTTTQSSATTPNNNQQEPIPALSSRTFQIDPAQLKSRSLNTLRFFGSSSPIFMLFEGRNRQALSSNGQPILHTSNSNNESYVSLTSPLPPAITEVLKKSKDSLDTSQLETLRNRGAFLIPDKALCDDLIRTYFNEIYTVEPLIDKAEFMRDYKNGTVSLLLLQSVFLAASCVSSNPAVFAQDPYSETGKGEMSSYTASATFFKRAKLLFDAGYETDPIAVVQSLVMFLRFWDGFDDVMSNTYFWTRNAISIAQGFGFHRNIPASASSLGASDLRISKVLFWYLYQRDIASSIGFGRPKMIQLDDCDVTMLTLDDFPEDIPRINAEAFIQMIRVSEVASIVAQEQYSVRAERLNRKGDALAINHCDMLMSSWRNSLPSELQYSPQRETPFAVSVLNLYYYSIVCLCHRTSIASPVMINGKQYPSEGIVFKASRIIADIASKLMKRDELKLCPVYAISIFFNAAVTFLIHREFGNPLTSKSSKVGYDLTVQALSSLGLRYRLATTMRGALAVIENDPASRGHLLRMIRKTSDTNVNTGTSTPVNPATAAVSSEQVPFQQTTLSPPGSSSLSHSNTQFNNSNEPTMSVPTLSQNISSHILQPATTAAATQQQTTTTPSTTTNDIEFPDLYLFTHNLTSTNDSNFDPADLFPSSNFSFSNTNTFNTGRTPTPAHHGLAYILQPTSNANGQPTTPLQQQQYQSVMNQFGQQQQQSYNAPIQQQHQQYNQQVTSQYAHHQPGIPETPQFSTHNNATTPGTQQQINNLLWNANSNTNQVQTPGGQSTTSSNGLLSAGEMMVMDPSVKLDDLNINFNF
ncbi:hypothetical protein WICPIJ_001653 [Wickerhamomyces pijperi]|uniref:Zn(2)-C6 fungal-type domain-containing protein n=1 Tax=Wickerhamomyces pijperi TaxID=599730 RepID=A0A9P8TQE3_WICPI|nr:hypothetical protein WICPIJ_001653 [Wickerhamomyces pijperi]